MMFRAALFQISMVLLLQAANAQLSVPIGSGGVSVGPGGIELDTGGLIGVSATREPTPAPSKPPTAKPTSAPTQPPVSPAPTRSPTKGSGTGDPHFKTWTGDKFDYHGECDLVLVEHPTFNDGQGLRVHIRTTRVKYFSYIERIAVQIGEDTLEFGNDAQKFYINGEQVEPSHLGVNRFLGDFVIKRYKKNISIRLNDAEDRSERAKIDIYSRKTGFPTVIVDGGKTDVFAGSLGLLGDWATGRKMARDGSTEIAVKDGDATEYALEWQVRDTEPLLFMDARFPQFPTKCTPPKAMVGGRLGAKAMREKAEKACAHWNQEDIDDCIFDVVATRSFAVAAEGHVADAE